MCPEQTELMRLLNGELPETQQAPVIAHLASCDRCREHFEAMRQTWKVLGLWNVAPPQPAAFTQCVMNSALSEKTAASKREDARGYLMRLAAAVALATGVGVATARLIPMPEKHSQARSDVSAEQVYQAMGLDALSGDSTSAFGDLYDADDTGAEEQPS